MYIANEPTVECDSRNLHCWHACYRMCVLYRWCAHCRIQVEGCVSLVRPLYDASLGMYIIGAPTVECESRDVYRWCAHCRM